MEREQKALYWSIVNGAGKAFSIDGIEQVMSDLHCSKIKAVNTDKADISFPLGKLSIPASLYDKWFKEDRIFIFNSLDNLEYLGISKIESNR